MGTSCAYDQSRLCGLTKRSFTDAWVLLSALEGSKTRAAPCYLGEEIALAVPTKDLKLCTLRFIQKLMLDVAHKWTIIHASSHV